MNKYDIAEEALTGIFKTERFGGADATWLAYALRFVVGAYVTGNIQKAVNGLETDGHASGFTAINQKGLSEMRHRAQKRTA